MPKSLTIQSAPGESGRRRKLSDELADRIRHHIVSNQLRSHDRLPQEKALIEQLGASRATVREALKSLEVQGLIYNTTGPSGGARVADVSVERAIALLRNFFYFNPVDAQQLYQVRLQIEPELAASAVGHLTAEHFEALEGCVAMQEETEIDFGSWAQHREAEIWFHDILASACPNPLLALMARFINQVVRTSIELTRSPESFDAARAFTHDNVRCHRAILKALKQGNPSKTRLLMRKHLEAAEPYVKDFTAQTEAASPDARAGLSVPTNFDEQPPLSRVSRPSKTPRADANQRGRPFTQSSGKKS